MKPFADSVAIILGASKWPKFPEFESHPGFEQSAEFFRDYLFEHGLPKTHLLPLFNNKQQPGTIIERIATFLRKRAGDTVRNVLFYYVGHGGYRKDSYYVALRCTNADNLDLTMLPVGQVAKVLAKETQNKRQILFIDACYAAGAVKDFIYQSNKGFGEDVHREVRAHLPLVNIERGTSLFCAAGPTARAKAPWGDSFTMFTGSLRRVLIAGDPTSGKLLSLARVAELVEEAIKATFPEEGVRPELHTPAQEVGDIRKLPLFPNPAAADASSPGYIDAVKQELDQLPPAVQPLAHELAWEQESGKLGWYELIELQKDIDQFGDLAQRHTIRGIHGPKKGEIRAIPFAFHAMPQLGNSVLDRITDEHRSQDTHKLPHPGMALAGELTLTPPATATVTHKGFRVDTRLINTFAMTTRDAQLRNHTPHERTSMRARFPARVLRLILTFPKDFAPVETPRVEAMMPTDISHPIESWPESAAETARVLPGFFYDASKGYAVLNVERALPDFHYVLSWKLPTPPSSELEEAARAKEQVRDLFAMKKKNRERVEAHLHAIRDEIGKTHLGWRRNRSRAVNLSLFAFDEKRRVARVVCATFADSVRRNFELPWGAGVVGWAMRRRRPAFVDVKDRGDAGIYRPVPGFDEHYVLCVPVHLPSDSQLLHLLQDPAMPCLVASLSCSDDSGNFERLKRSSKLMATLATDLAKQVLEMVTEATL